VHEIREIVRNLLELLAPDEKLMGQPGFKLETNTRGPTHKQRARYILKQRGAGSKEQEVVAHIDLIEERISSLVRSTYTRASVAAHGAKGRTEVVRTLHYFRAFAHDLLDLNSS
jgi:hypothetical protein